jgi:YARHG domain
MRTLLFSAFLAVSMTFSGLVVSAANAQEGACLRLWVARNAIYKDNGFCFKTERAISYFGNAGCMYNYEGDIPMSRYDRARLARIQAEEREMGCR